MFSIGVNMKYHFNVPVVPSENQLMRIIPLEEAPLYVNHPLSEVREAANIVLEKG